MDPFLESHYFGSLHSNVITYTQETLQKQLPADYYALTSERVWIDTSQRWIEPDNFVTRSTRRPRKTNGGTVAVATRTKPIIVTVPHDEHTEPFLEIFQKRGDKQRLVCTIEILSLSNKTPGQKGQKLYRRKQREVLARKVHLVEIDLLRGGNHTTAVALDWAKAKTGEFDYHVCVRRFNRFEEFEVYPILMQQELPTIAIPLLPADGDVSLDLQAIFQRAYEAGPYARSLDYRTEPLDPPLSARQETWMREVLRKAGIRRKSS
jgi:hypothetical protein